jgi:hypothetical protein
MNFVPFFVNSVVKNNHKGHKDFHRESQGCALYKYYFMPFYYVSF